GGAFVEWIYYDRIPEYVHVMHHFGDGTVRIADPTGFGGLGLPPRACADGDAGAFVSWGGWGVQLQHVSSSDAVDPHWPTDGIQLSSFPEVESPAGLCSDGAGGVFVAWLEQHGGANDQCMIQHVTDSSAIAPGWPAGGLIVSPYPCRAGGFRDGPIYF